MRQSVPFDAILLLLNNCSDRTAQLCFSFQLIMPQLKIVECELHKKVASAGEARRLALQRALELSGDDGVILTTDADALPEPDWLEQNLAEIERGADVVCGAASLERADEQLIRPGLRFDDMREVLLLQMLDEIETWIDPDSYDPWPRHQEDSGASIAMRGRSFRQSGGVPRVAVGEDRALVERLRLIDAKIRHSPKIVVRVSGRLEGRAEGGMADTIKRRIVRQDEFTDERLEPAVDAYRRALAKARLRKTYYDDANVAVLTKDLLISPAEMQRALDAPFFGAAWMEVQRLSAVLQRRRVAYAGLARETRQAMAMLNDLRSNFAAMQREAAYGSGFTD